MRIKQIDSDLKREILKSKREPDSLDSDIPVYCDEGDLTYMDTRITFTC
jgi:hypothetical protein